MNQGPFTSDKSGNIIMDGYLNLPNVDWANGLFVSPLNSIRQHFRKQNEFLDLFTTKE